MMHGKTKIKFLNNQINTIATLLSKNNPHMSLLGRLMSRPPSESGLEYEEQKRVFNL